MRRVLPPVGRVIKKPKLNWQLTGDIPELEIDGIEPVLYESGTQALAAALIAAKAQKKVPDPEVIIPAYGCPALISAALYAGITPVLVDLKVDSPFFDVEAMKLNIKDNTVAVLAAHFLGMSEDVRNLATLLDRDIFLIEDSAQYFKNDITKSVWHGDFVILSFGRGKPVSILRGGAVLCRSSEIKLSLPGRKQIGSLTSCRLQQLLLNIKIAIYNIFLSPGYYGIMQKLPFLHLGRTQFSKLEKVSRFPTCLSHYISRNMESDNKEILIRQKWISSILKEIGSPEIQSLPEKVGSPSDTPLLRYPLLVSNVELRNKLFQALEAEGLGSSVMYSNIITDVPGVSDLDLRIGKGGNKNAMDFADKLITLPCHQGVKKDDVLRMKEIMIRCLSV
jgi:dTDP-4-amino-4,6-dideoxygalactose transaminase